MSRQLIWGLSLLGLFVITGCSSTPPLFKAVQSGNKEKVTRLLDAGESLDSREGLLGRTPLHLAARSGHSNIVQVLVSRKANPNATDDGNYIELKLFRLGFKAKQRLTEACIIVAIDKDLYRVEAAPPTIGYSPIALAAMKGHVGIVKMLLDAGADVDTVDWLGMTPFLWALYANQEATADLLLAAGANPKTCDNAKRTSLHFVCTTNLGERLLKAGVDINSRDELGDLPLHSVLDNTPVRMRGRDELGDLPLYSVLDNPPVRMRNASGGLGQSPRQIADFFEWLVSRGADVNAVNRKKEIPLEPLSTMMGAFWQMPRKDAFGGFSKDPLERHDMYRRMCRALIDKGADPRQVMKPSSLVDAAILNSIGEYRDLEFIKYLLDHGARPSARMHSLLKGVIGISVLPGMLNWPPDFKKRVAELLNQYE